MGFPALGSSITELASQYRATQFTAVAVITLWAYDYLLTFADEVELVWKRRQFSWTKVLFSINRYLPVIHCFFVGMQSLPTRQIHIGSLRDCHAHLVVITFSSAFHVIVTITVFGMRAYALSHRHPYFQRFLVVSIIISHIALIVFTALTVEVYYHHMVFISSRCMLLERVHSWYPSLICLAPSLVETLIFGTTMHHAIHFHRGISTVDDSRSFGLLKTLYSHGIQYYTMVICLRLAVILGFYIAPLGMQLLFPIFVFYTASMMTSRFILSLQREMVNLQTEHESLMKTSPDITFSNHGRSQTTQYPLELHNLGRRTNCGPSIIIVTDERDQFSTTEQGSFTANGQSSRSNHSGLVTRSLP